RYPNLEKKAAWSANHGSFLAKRAIMNVIDANDGTHIPIKQPPNNPWNSYINSKQWASIQCQ
ncbi:hypothetical protein BDK51DRAFT_10920, partial [Blyttiomyces helicus]